MSLKQGVARASRALGQVLRMLFGELRWHPPQWMRALGTRGAAAMRRARARPVATAAFLAALLALTASGVLALRWMQLRPKPVLIAFDVTAPARTCLECEPPGKPQPLIVTFSQPAAPLEAIGQAIQDGVELSPRQAGAWRWDSDRRLRFEPAADWPAGTAYRVRFDARTLLRPGARLKEAGTPVHRLVLVGTAAGHVEGARHYVTDAVAQLPEDFTADHPEVAWRSMKAILDGLPG